MAGSLYPLPVALIKASRSGLVKELLDLEEEILATTGARRVEPPFHPAMMVALLLYGYACGVYSSRRIAKACGERADFMMIVALDAPDSAPSGIRRRHLQALGGLFVQVLRLGLVLISGVMSDR